ncbi:MAG: hypothetical protein WCR45_10415 [Bacteroidaceae bacterium]
MFKSIGQIDHRNGVAEKSDTGTLRAGTYPATRKGMLQHRNNELLSLINRWQPFITIKSHKLIF